MIRRNAHNPRKSPPPIFDSMNNNGTQPRRLRPKLPRKQRNRDRIDTRKPKSRQASAHHHAAQATRKNQPRHARTRRQQPNLHQANFVELSQQQRRHPVSPTSSRHKKTRTSSSPSPATYFPDSWSRWPAKIRSRSQSRHTEKTAPPESDRVPFFHRIARATFQPTIRRCSRLNNRSRHQPRFQSPQQARIQPPLPAKAGLADSRGRSPQETDTRPRLRSNKN